jgi:hypothetical protein
LAKSGELHLAQRSLHTEQEPVVGQTRIIDSLLVDDKRAHEGTELEQRVPVAPVSSQSRGLDRDHRANRAFTYRRKQALEAWPLHARAGAAEILVKHDDLSLSKRSDTLCERVLTTLAFQIVSNLLWRRLANVDEGRPGKVIGPDSTHRSSPPRLKRSARSR